MSMDLSVEAITARIAEVAARLTPTGKVIRMDIGLSKAIVYDGRATPALVHNDDGASDASITMDFDTFVALSEGKTTGPAALMAGKLKIGGDMTAALAFQPIMDQVQREYRGG